MKRLKAFCVGIISCICVFGATELSYAQSVKTYEICVNKYCLLDTNSIDFSDESREIMFYNDDKTQYLKMTRHAGDYAKQYSIFEVGRCTDADADVFVHSPVLSFITNSGTCLNQTVDRICSIQGEPNSIYRNGDNSILYYEEEDVNSSFLMEYGAYKYHIEYCFFKDQLIKFVFGFDYP